MAYGFLLSVFIHHVLAKYTNMMENDDEEVNVTTIPESNLSSTTSLSAQTIIQETLVNLQSMSPEYWFVCLKKW